MSREWFETWAGQVRSVWEDGTGLSTELGQRAHGSQKREREAQGARHVGVSDGLPQAGALPDGGHQLDGGALQVVLDGGDDDRDDHQGHRRPCQ